MKELIVGFFTIFGLILFIGWVCSESPQEKRSIYEAWKLANPSHSQMSFQHFETLRDNDMLPGVDYATKHAKEARDSANAAAVMSGVAVGISASSSGK